MAAISDWTTEQLYKFEPMLKDFLQRKPCELESLGWVPSKLLVKALAA
jgi:hypothetical protein